MPEPITALVLSSGGFFGAYQAGAWSYLSQNRFRPDIIIGASVGALNGWAIAGGCRPADLASQWLDEKTSRILTRLKKPGLRAGYFQPQPLRDFAHEIYSQYRPAVNYGLVVIELPFLRSRLIPGHAVTAEHLAATASIPVAMPTITIDGKSFTDGGLIEDVPLWAALKMGATRIIAIDAMRFDSPWWYRASVRPIKMLAPRLRIPKRREITLIRPSRSLGSYTAALTWNRLHIQDWIDLGYEDARRTLALSDMPAPRVLL